MCGRLIVVEMGICPFVEKELVRISRFDTSLPDTPMLLGESLSRHPTRVQQSIDVSVVMPCLNEEECVASAVKEAFMGIRASGLVGEVVVVDNGSTDASIAKATEAGARVVTEAERGYGNACRRGLREARGQIIVLGDSDGTYDFREIPRLVEAMGKRGSGVVIGNRFSPGMETGAMPWLHRYVGNPGLTGVLNLLYSTKVSDAHCGLRAIKRSALTRLDLRSPGMEFASEFLVEAAAHNVGFAEIPVSYRRRMGGEPKLRTFRDGWRHLRLLVERRFRQIVDGGRREAERVSPIHETANEPV